MAVRTKLLAIGGSISSGLKTVYTTPEGRTTILKYVTLRNGSAASVRIVVYLGIAASGVAIVFIDQTVATAAVFSASTYVVVPAGYRLVVDMAPAASIQYTFSGSELEGEPEVPTAPTFVLEGPGPLPA